MASLALQKAETVSATHPRCAVCAVPMLLVKIEQHFSRDPRLVRHHFECMACGAPAITPPDESMGEHQRVSLTLIETPARRHAVSAPPVLVASTHTIDYCCGHCGTALMHAEDGQVHNLVIHCTVCGSYNSTAS